MKLGPHFKEALANLFSSRLRTFLAMLGILVGTASVVALVSSGELATQQALEQFKVLGTDLLSVAIYQNQSVKHSESDSKLELSDALNIKSEIKEATSIAPYIVSYVPITFNDIKIDAGIIGATEALQDTIKIKIKTGRFVSDLDKFSFYCVVGSKVLQDMQVLNPIGKQIKLGTNIFTIIGIAEEWPENAFFSQDINSSIIVPLQSAKLLSRYANINNMVMRLHEGADISQVQIQITNYINKKLPDQNLFFHSAKEIIKSMSKQQEIFTLLLGLIGSISLLVGGIGVMNIMLVSVVERRREIGIRLAIGARRKDIQIMFLIEAITLSLIGGLIGVVVGILTSFIIAYFAQWQFSIFILPPIVGFLVSAMVGIFFGYYPAYQASQLNPIETLRAE